MLHTTLTDFGKLLYFTTKMLLWLVLVFFLVATVLVRAQSVA